jgi:hypothetical protein
MLRPERPEESPRRDGNGFAPASRAYETRAAARGGIPKEGGQLLAILLYLFRP